MAFTLWISAAQIITRRRQWAGDSASHAVIWRYDVAGFSGLAGSAGVAASRPCRWVVGGGCRTGTFCKFTSSPCECLRKLTGFYKLPFGLRWSAISQILHARQSSRVLPKQALQAHTFDRFTRYTSPRLHPRTKPSPLERTRKFPHMELLQPLSTSYTLLSRGELKIEQPFGGAFSGTGQLHFSVHSQIPVRAQFRRIQHLSTSAQQHITTFAPAHTSLALTRTTSRVNIHATTTWRRQRPSHSFLRQITYSQRKSSLNGAVEPTRRAAIDFPVLVFLLSFTWLATDTLWQLTSRQRRNPWSAHNDDRREMSPCHIRCCLTGNKVTCLDSNFSL